jgi:hypothetical protein
MVALGEQLALNHRKRERHALCDVQNAARFTAR